MIYLTLQPLYPLRKDSRFPVKKRLSEIYIFHSFYYDETVTTKAHGSPQLQYCLKTSTPTCLSQGPKYVGGEVLKYCCDSSELCAFVGWRKNVWVNLITGFYAGIKKEILVVAEVEPRFFRSQQWEPSTVMTIKADSHIACSVHAAPMPFPCHAVRLRV